MEQRAKRNDRSVFPEASFERRAFARREIPFERCLIIGWAFGLWQLLHAYTFMVGLLGIEALDEDLDAQVLDRPCLRVLATTVVFVYAEVIDMHGSLETVLEPVLDAQCHGLPDEALKLSRRTRCHN